MQSKRLLVLLLAGQAGAACATAPRPLHARAVELQAAGARSVARGNWDRAAGQFALALEYEPRMASAHSGLGLVALGRGDHATAESRFRAALALDEELAEAHLNLGQVLLGRDEVEEALGHFRQALAIDPGFGGARLAAAEALLRQGHYEEARWELAKLCEVEPDRAGAHAAHALVLAKLDRIAAAEAAVRKGLALDPDLPAAHRARAEILRRRGDHGAAAMALRKVLEAEPGSVQDRVALVVVLVAANDAAAEGELDALEAAAPTRAEISFARAVWALGRGRYQEAITAGRRALDLRPKYPQARLVLAEALFRAGQGEAGARELRLFVDESPPEMKEERRAAERFLETRGE